MKTVLMKMMIIAALAAPMAACGVKPKQVDPPEAVKDDVFPNRYPAEEME